MKFLIKYKSVPIWFLFFLDIVLFLYFRFYKINSSLVFFNDMGRDFWVLDQWRISGKPPLLGPQTSALPFNQSAIYFYFLYPFFLITRQSPLSALYANAFIYLLPFIFGFIFLKNFPKLRQSLLLVFFLISIHPQYIIQSRFIWNPSFVSPFFLASIYALLVYFQTKKSYLIYLFSLFLAIAISLTYSVVPEALVLLFLALVFLPTARLRLIISFPALLFLANLPTVFFELRHHFLLTTSLLTKKSPPQMDIYLLSKMNNLSSFLFNADTKLVNYIFLLIIFAIALIILIKQKSYFRILSLAFLLSLVFTILIPITVQAHYVFGILCLIFIIVSLLPPKYSVSALILPVFFYLQPSKLAQYFQPAPRTYQSMARCYSDFCSASNKPIFVTVQSNLHPYHTGPEHRYLLRKSGCSVKEIETEPSAASSMVVVGDGSDYMPGKTQYYELSLFGPSKLVSTKTCQDNLKLYLLDRI